MEYSSKGHIVKVRNLLARNLQEFKSPEIDWGSPGHFFRFVDATYKSLDLIHMCISEVNTLLTAQGLKDVSKINNLVFETLVYQLSISVTNATQNTLQKSKYNNPPAPGAELAKGKAVDAQPTTERPESQFKIRKLRQLENTPMVHAPGKSPAPQSESCACVCHEAIEQFKRKVQNLRNHIIEYEDTTVQLSEEPKRKSYFNRLTGNVLLEREAERVFGEFQKGNTEVIKTIQNPLVLLQVNQRILNSMLEDHYESKKDMEVLLSNIDGCDLRRPGQSPMEAKLKSILAQNYEVLLHPTPKFVQEIVSALDMEGMEADFHEKLVASLKLLYAKYLEAVRDAKDTLSCHVGTNTKTVWTNLEERENELAGQINVKEAEIESLREYLAKANLEIKCLVKEEEKHQTFREEMEKTLDAERERIVEAKAHTEQLGEQIAAQNRQMDQVKEYLQAMVRLFRRYEPHIVDFHESMIYNSYLLEKKVKKGEKAPEELLTLLLSGKGTLLFNYRLLENLSRWLESGFSGFNVNYENPLKDLDADVLEETMDPVDENATPKSEGGVSHGSAESDSSRLMAGLLGRKGFVFRSDKVKKLQGNQNIMNQIILDATEGGQQGDKKFETGPDSPQIFLKPPRDKKSRMRGGDGPSRSSLVVSEASENSKADFDDEDEEGGPLSSSEAAKKREKRKESKAPTKGSKKKPPIFQKKIERVASDSSSGEALETNDKNDQPETEGAQKSRDKKKRSSSKKNSPGEETEEDEEDSAGEGGPVGRKTSGRMTSKDPSGQVKAPRKTGVGKEMSQEPSRETSGKGPRATRRQSQAQPGAPNEVRRSKSSRRAAGERSGEESYTESDSAYSDDGEGDNFSSKKARKRSKKRRNRAKNGSGGLEDGSESSDYEGEEAGGRTGKPAGRGTSAGKSDSQSRRATIQRQGGKSGRTQEPEYEEIEEEQIGPDGQKVMVRRRVVSQKQRRPTRAGHDGGEEVDEDSFSGEESRDPKDPGYQREGSKGRRPKGSSRGGAGRSSKTNGGREASESLDEDETEYTREGGAARSRSHRSKGAPRKVGFEDAPEQSDEEEDPQSRGGQERRRGRSHRSRRDRPDGHLDDDPDSEEDQGEEGSQPRGASRSTKRGHSRRRVDFANGEPMENQSSGSDHEGPSHERASRGGSQVRRATRKPIKLNEPTFVQHVAEDGTVTFVEHTGDAPVPEQVRYVQRKTVDGQIEYVEEAKVLAEMVRQRAESRLARRSEAGLRDSEDSYEDESEEVDWAIQKKGVIIFQGKTEGYNIQAVLHMLTEQIKKAQRDPTAPPGLETRLTEELANLIQQMDRKNPQGNVNFQPVLRSKMGDPGVGGPNQGVPSLLLQKRLSHLNKKGALADLDSSTVVHERAEGDLKFRMAKPNESGDLSVDAAEHQASRFTTQPNTRASHLEGEEDTENQFENTPSKYFKGRGAVFTKIKPNIILGSMTKNTTPFVPDIQHLGFCLQNTRIAAPGTPQKPKTEAKPQPAPVEGRDSLLPLPATGQLAQPIEDLRTKINAITNPVVKKLHQIIYCEKLQPTEISTNQSEGPRVMPTIFRKKLSEAAMQSDVLLAMIKSRLLEAYVATKTGFDWAAIQEKGQKYISGFIKFHAGCGRACVHLDEFCQFLKVYLTKVVGGLPLGVPLMPLDNIQVTKISQRIKR